MQHKQVDVDWQGRGMVFSGGSSGRTPVVIDGDGAEGPSPVDTLLIALAGCTASDVVMILEKKRLQLTELRVAVTGERRDEYPRRFLSIKLVFTISARGATDAAVRQAIDLSMEKYCSVSHSLNPDIPVTYDLVLQA